MTKSLQQRECSVLASVYQNDSIIIALMLKLRLVSVVHINRIHTGLKSALLGTL